MLTDLTNEPLVIAGIRVSMAQILLLSRRWNEDYAAQSAAYLRDVNLPAVPGEFTALAESRTSLEAEYVTIRHEIIGQKNAYDAFCHQHGMAYSDNWNRLLEELRPYVSDIKLPGMTEGIAACAKPAC